MFYDSTIASTHSNKNDKTTQLLITEIQYRLDWIGIEFLHNADNTEIGSLEAERHGNGLRLLDYGCGSGMVSLVRFSVLPLN
jgi:ribosomal protein L11 methylase PrmA